MVAVVKYVADMTFTTGTEYAVMLARLQASPAVTKLTFNASKRSIHVEWTDPDYRMT